MWSLREPIKKGLGKGQSGAKEMGGVLGRGSGVCKCLGTADSGS